jgi:ABC-type multidrug transport system fused ATPase/permease subunit
VISVIEVRWRQGVKMSSADANVSMNVSAVSNVDEQQVAIDIAAQVEPQVEAIPVEQKVPEIARTSIFDMASFAAGLNQVALMDVGGGLEKTSVIVPGREVEDQLAELLKPPEELYRKRPMDKIAALIKNKVVLVPKKTGPGADYQDLDMGKKEQLVKMVMEDSGMDNLVLMRKIRDRYEALGINPPGVEVRFEHLKVTADVLVGSRGMPGLTNDVRSMAMDAISPLMRLIGAKKEKKKHVVLLDSISGVLKPGRLTLLLGPPGAGKSTLLRSLAGQLKDKRLEKHGSVLYNGKHIDSSDFVTERTGAYIDQVDRHLAEMTVRETLAFSSRMMGQGYDKDPIMTR